MVQLLSTLPHLSFLGGRGIEIKDLDFHIDVPFRYISFVISVYRPIL